MKLILKALLRTFGFIAGFVVWCIIVHFLMVLAPWVLTSLMILVMLFAIFMAIYQDLKYKEKRKKRYEN